MEEDTDAAAASLHLGPEDVLVVPKYLVEMPLDPSLAAYRRVRFSKTIRSTASARPVKLDLQDKSHLTAVLPDHVYAGNWTHFRERFPRDAQFVLCTDGFYSAFAEPQELWEWLTEHGTRLEAEETKEGVMAELHHRLRERQGDDDISFVWVAARQTGETEPLDPMMSPDGGEDHAC